MMLWFINLRKSPKADSSMPRSILLADFYGFTRNCPGRRKIKEISHFDSKGGGNLFEESRPWPSLTQLDGSDSAGADADLGRIFLSTQAGQVSEFAYSDPELGLQFRHT
jgi:hypothetical protein